MIWWRPRSSARLGADNGGVPSPLYPALEVVGETVERSIDAQERRVNSLDQRGGVLLGASGVLVAVTAQRAPELGWFAVATGLLAAAAALCSALEIRPRSPNAVQPRKLLEKWAKGDPERVRLVILSTVADSYDREEAAAPQKGRLLTAAVVLLACAVGALLAEVTVGSGVFHQVTTVLGRTS